MDSENSMNSFERKKGFFNQFVNNFSEFLLCKIIIIIIIIIFNRLDKKNVLQKK